MHRISKALQWALLNALLVAPMQQLDAQAPSPVADALRKAVAEVGHNLVLAAEGMPAAKFAARAYAFAPTFGETMTEVVNYSALYCQQVTGTSDARNWIEADVSRDSLVVVLKANLAYCARTLARLDDTRLADTVRFDGLKTRATVIREFSSYLAARYEYLTTVMRLQNLVPPMKCSGAGGAINCGSGENLCFAHSTAFVAAPLMATLADSAYTVRSDGKGPYVRGTSNVQVTSVGRAGVMVLGRLGLAEAQRRAVLIDLSKPVSGSGAQSLGVVRADQFMEVAGQWESDRANHRPKSLVDIPVGATVTAKQIDVEFSIDGQVHALQAGPQPIGHCFSDEPATHGRGTTTGTISHPDTDTWIVELPPGSVMRLFNVDKRYPYAVDRGLYQMSLRLTLRKSK